MHKIRLIIIGLISSAIMNFSLAMAQIQGPMYVINVSGLPMNCTSFDGIPVAIFSNPQLSDVGVASRQFSGRPTIQLNPVVMARFSPIVSQWWFAHECAHHALPPFRNSESNADCFGATELVRVGILNNKFQLDQFLRELGGLPGNMQTGHLPGYARAANIANCAVFASRPFMR